MRANVVPLMGLIHDPRPVPHALLPIDPDVSKTR